MKKIYILDDDMDFLELMESVLHKHYKLATGSTFNITELTAFNPDLLLLDNNIGSTKSETVLSELNKLVPGFNVPVIMMSGNDRHMLKSSALVKGFIPKPTSIKQIKQTLSEFFVMVG